MASVRQDGHLLLVLWLLRAPPNSGTPLLFVSIVLLHTSACGVRGQVCSLRSRVAMIWSWVSGLRRGPLGHGQVGGRTRSTPRASQHTLAALHEDPAYLDPSETLPVSELLPLASACLRSLFFLTVNA